LGLSREKADAGKSSDSLTGEFCEFFSQVWKLLTTAYKSGKMLEGVLSGVYAVYVTVKKAGGGGDISSCGGEGSELWGA